MSGHTETTQVTDDEHPSLWRNRNFRRFFVGQFVTNAGDSLYIVAILWLVFDLSGSTVLTGVANSLLLLPFLLQIVAGPIVDRLPAKSVLVGCQAIQGVVVLVLPIAAYTGHLTVELVLMLIPALSLVTLLMAPVRATVVPRIVPEERLSRSNSMLSTISLGLDMLFDALGGLFVAAFGATALFLLDSVTFAVAGLLFAGMAIPAVGDGAGDESPSAGFEDDGTGADGTESARSVLENYVDDLRDGVDVLRGTVFVDMLFVSAVRNFAVGVTLAILPAFGASLGGAGIYGLLLGALGVGRLIGSVSASYLDGIPFGRLMAGSYLVSATLWLGSVYAPTTALTVGLFGLAWISAAIDDVLVETLNQKVFPADLLGRVSAIKGTASTATLPAGSLVGGLIAASLGTTTTMGLAAFGFGFVGLYFALRRSLRELPAMTEVHPSAFGVHTDAPPAAAVDDD